MKKPVRGHCALCQQRMTGVFAGLDAEALSRIDRQRTIQSFEPGQEIFCEGGPPLAVYCLHAGRVRLSMSGDRGEALVLEFGEPGRLLGLRAVLAGEPYESTATAVEASAACTIPAEVLDDLLDHSPGLARAAARLLARDVHRAHARLLDALQRSVPQRVAHALLELHDSSRAVSPGTPEPLGIRRSDLAHMIGTTPETLSRVLHVFESRGAVRVTRKDIRVSDAGLLRAIARMPLEES